MGLSTRVDGRTRSKGKIQGDGTPGVTDVIVFLRPPFDHALMQRFDAEITPAFRR
jgi:hypothetical protein